MAVVFRKCLFISVFHTIIESTVTITFNFEKIDFHNKLIECTGTHQLAYDHDVRNYSDSRNY